MERHKNPFLVLPRVLIQFRIKKKKKDQLVKVIKRPFLFKTRRIYHWCPKLVCAASGSLTFWLPKSKGSKYVCVSCNMLIYVYII